MKKILATALLASVSMGVMASPANCLLNWAKKQGAVLTQQNTYLKAWGSQGEFSWNQQSLAIGYGITVKNDPKKGGISDQVLAGPWNCHCTEYKHYPEPGSDGPIDATGVCGYW